MTTTITYDDKSVRRFMIASIFWGIIGMLVGVLIATQLSWWQMNGHIPGMAHRRRDQGGRHFLPHLRPAASAAHQRGDLRLRRQHDVRRHLLLDPAAAARRACLATCSRSIHFWGWQLIIVAAAITLPLGLHPRQGIRRARSGRSTSPSPSSGWSSRSTSSGPSPSAASRTCTWRIWFYIATIVTVAMLYIVNHLSIPTALDPELLDLRRRAGRAGAMVVWAQRRGLLPHHADPRHDVLLPAQGGEPAGVFLPALDHPLLVADLHLHLGRAASPALHRAAATGLQIARHGLLAHALGALLGRHAQRPAHPARRLGQGAQRSGAQVHRRRRHLLRHGHLRRARCSPSRRVNALSHYTDWTIAHVHTGALGWNGFMAAGMFYWLAPAPLEHQALVHQARQHPLLDRPGRHPALRRRDVVRRHHPGPDAQRSSTDGGTTLEYRIPRDPRKHPDLLHPALDRRRALPHRLRPAAPINIWQDRPLRRRPYDETVEVTVLEREAEGRHALGRSRSSTTRSPTSSSAMALRPPVVLPAAARRQGRAAGRRRPARRSRPTPRFKAAKDSWADWHERLLENYLPFTVLVFVAVAIGGVVQIIPTLIVNRAEEHRGPPPGTLHAARTRRPRHLRLAKAATTATRR